MLLFKNKMIFNLKKEDHIVIKWRLDKKIARGEPHSERIYKHDFRVSHSVDLWLSKEKVKRQ